MSPAAAAEPGLLVTVGEVTDTAAVVWVRGVTWGEVTVRYEPLGRAPAARAGRPRAPAARSGWSRAAT